MTSMRRGYGCTMYSVQCTCKNNETCESESEEEKHCFISDALKAIDKDQLNSQKKNWTSCPHSIAQSRVEKRREMLLLLFLPNVFALPHLHLSLLVSNTMMAEASFSSPISMLGPALVEAVYR